MKEEDFLKVDIDNKNSKTLRNDLKFIGVDNIIKVKNQARIDWMHKITHRIAWCIIISFLLLLLIQIFFRPEKIIMPNYFISIVSVIIGFYFARSLPFKKEKD